MRNKITPKPPKHPKENPNNVDELIEECIKKGLIEKTEFGYIFTKEFFETLEIYEE